MLQEFFITRIDIFVHFMVQIVPLDFILLLEEYTSLTKTCFTVVGLKCELLSKSLGNEMSNIWDIPGE